MKKTASPDFEECEVVKDLHHLLMECVRYESGRNSLRSDLNLNRAEVGMFNKILTEANSDDTKALQIHDDCF